MSGIIQLWFSLWCFQQQQQQLKEYTDFFACRKPKRMNHSFTFYSVQVNEVISVNLIDAFASCLSVDPSAKFKCKQ